MLSKMRKMLKSQKGFTLIELITVIVILGVILGIGLPRYAKMQARSEWDSDVATLQNFLKAAEVYYAMDNTASETVTAAQLGTANLFDQNTVLKRNATGRNTTNATMSTVQVTLDPATGAIALSGAANIDTAINTWMQTYIGTRP